MSQADELMKGFKVGYQNSPYSALGSAIKSTIGRLTQQEDMSNEYGMKMGGEMLMQKFKAPYERQKMQFESDLALNRGKQLASHEAELKRGTPESQASAMELANARENFLSTRLQGIEQQVSGETLTDEETQQAIEDLRNSGIDEQTIQRLQDENRKRIMKNRRWKPTLMEGGFDKGAITLNASPGLSRAFQMLGRASVPREDYLTERAKLALIKKAQSEGQGSKIWQSFQPR